ncbi:putative phosphatase regulatory subunit-domain-containing protein [Gaertneriomyces semiglobifer]|nr:putative phosphatase regulatory subunit-domain-containing protein [Gaertneriomyces semiglobifer]
MPTGRLILLGGDHLEQATKQQQQCPRSGSFLVKADSSLDFDDDRAVRRSYSLDLDIDGNKIKPCLKKSLSATEKSKKKKKRLAFDESLERVSLFRKEAEPAQVASGEQYILKDTGDYEAYTLGASLDRLHCWRMCDGRNVPYNTLGLSRSAVVLHGLKLADNRILVAEVAVQNIAFAKAVIIRYTTDNWATYTEGSAEYQKSLSRSGGGVLGADQFTWEADLNDIFGVDATEGRLDMAVRYEVAGQTHWDNNNGQNYYVCFERPTHQQYVASKRAYRLSAPVVTGGRQRYSPDPDFATPPVRRSPTGLLAPKNLEFLPMAAPAASTPMSISPALPIPMGKSTIPSGMTTPPFSSSPPISSFMANAARCGDPYSSQRRGNSFGNLNNSASTPSRAPTPAPIEVPFSSLGMSSLYSSYSSYRQLGYSH